MNNYNPITAVILATAAVELFPGVQIIAGEGTAQYFFYDFVFHEFHPDCLPILEERVRLILRENRPVRMMEMLPANAADLMRHRGQKLAAEQLMQIDAATVPMVQIGDFTAYCPQAPIENIPALHVKILEGYPIGGKVVRIVGAASLDKETLKKIAKLPSVSSRSYVKQAPELGLFEQEGMWCWTGKGEALRRLLTDFWQSCCEKENFNCIASPVATEEETVRSHRDYHLRFGVDRTAQMTWIHNEEYQGPSPGLFAPKTYYGDRLFLFCPREKLLENCISSLRFIVKIPKILGFEFEIALSISGEAKAKGATILRQALEKTELPYVVEKKYRQGSVASVEIRMADALGRSWTGPFLRVIDGKDAALALSLFGSMERVCALLIEGSGDSLDEFYTRLKREMEIGNS